MAILSSYRNTLFLYVLFFLILIMPYWLKGEVIAPHRQLIELAADQSKDYSFIENRKFSDYPTVYIPEITAQIKTPKIGWIATWTNKNELGRPLFHLSGYSPAYLPTYLLSRMTDDPYVIFTFLSLSLCFLAGLFMFLFCRQLELVPLACLVASGGIASSPFFMYWLTFPMFSSIFCWAVGILYSTTRIFKKPDLIGWSILSFSVYSLLMTAYPQGIVYNFYLLAGYCCYRLCHVWTESGGRSSFFRIFYIVTACIVGIVCASPVYLDLAHAASESIRLSADPSFFTAVLPKFQSLHEIVRFLVMGTFPEIYGNPITPSYPFSYDGLSVTPLFVFLASVSLLLKFRETWGWWLFIGILCSFSFIHPLFVFGVKYLGLHFSRCNPLGFILIPLIVISAYGVDSLVNRRKGSEVRAIILGWVCVVAGLFVAIGFGLNMEIKIQWLTVALTFVVSLLFLIQARRLYPYLLFASLIMVDAYISYPLMLRQISSEIADRSPFTEMIRQNLPEGSSYAVVSPGISLLPPNMNATLELPSIHSYNSLSSRYYHKLIGGLGGEMITYGRWNNAISPNYSSPLFWMSNIGLILSPNMIQHENLVYCGESNGVHFYRVLSRMGCCIQIPISGEKIRDNINIENPRKLKVIKLSKTINQGDYFEFDLSSATESLLILSQKYHRDWQAEVLTVTGWSIAKTVSVNDIFQGIILPNGAQKVTLHFEPKVRYMWIGHVFWIILLLIIFLKLVSCRLSSCRHFYIQADSL